MKTEEEKEEIRESLIEEIRSLEKSLRTRKRILEFVEAVKVFDGHSKAISWEDFLSFCKTRDSYLGQKLEKVKVTKFRRGRLEFEGSPSEISTISLFRGRLKDLLSDYTGETFTMKLGGRNE